jgi:hypothetical protein
VSEQPAKITREDVEARFRAIQGEVGTELESARPRLVAIGAATLVVIVAAAFLAGRRRGRRRSAVIEVRRI